MAALDDALGSAAIVFGTHPVTVSWREVQSTEATDNPSDSLSDISGQRTDFTITHGLDDALPDPVTMTGNGDAAGVLSMGVTGRDGLRLGTSGTRAFVNSNSLTSSWYSQTFTHTLSVPIPSSVVPGDSLIAAVVVDSPITTIVQLNTDPKDQWQFLGSIGDAPYQIFVYFKRRWNSGNAALSLWSDITVNYLVQVIPFFSRSPSGAVMDLRVSGVQFGVETGTSVLPHTLTSMQPTDGYTVNLWGSNTSIGTITPSANLMGNPGANNVQLASAVSPLRSAKQYSATASSASGASAVPMAAITIEPFPRPVFSPKQWWSPFNTDSPISSFSRDTADVSTSIRTITATGGVDTLIFKGQMQGTPIQGEEVTLNAVSKARIRMNRSVQLPVVGALREGLNLDWLVTYLMARGGSFVGPAPTKYTRYWNPLYGSIHAHWGTWRDYNAAYFWDTKNPLLLFGYKYPQPVDGKFFRGMDASQTASKTVQLSLGARSSYTFPTNDFPHLWDNGGTGPVMADWMSLANSRGRIAFWVRGDAVTAAPSYLPSGNDWMVQFSVKANSNTGAFLGYVSLTINSSNRQPTISMGNDSHGYGNVLLGSLFAVPSDGQWHFVGFAWDFANGQYLYQMDSQKLTGVSTFFATNGWNDTSQLQATDAQLRALGGTTGFNFNTHVPTSDVLIDSGNPALFLNFFDDNYPTPTMPNAMNATMRTTNLPLEGLSIEGPVNVWDTFADVARNALAMYRANEGDALEFLPPSYFGETAQMTPAAIQDTATNSTALEAIADPTVIRNVITLKFQDTRVDTKPQPVLQYLTSITISPGTTLLTMPLDAPAVEIHGAADYSSTAYQIVNLTAAQITGVQPVSHYITANDAADGSGNVLANSLVKATIDSYSAQSVVLRIVNNTGKTVYLVNNGDQVPYINILGYGLRQADAYTTVRDDASVLLRTERSLDADFNWIQNRTTATDIAAQLVNQLARPRIQVALVCVADPRRKPGQLATITDASGTKVSGTWRILTVQHSVSGASYLQGITAVQVFPAAVWDGLDGWDNAVWS